MFPPYILFKKPKPMSLNKKKVEKFEFIII